MPMAQQRLLDINGTEIFADIRGAEANPPVLYLHGGPGMSCWDFMRAQGDRLAERLRIIGIDQRGILRSARVSETIVRQTIVDDCEAIRKALGIDAWAVLGHSVGGGYALEYLYQHPETVTSAIFDCPTFDADATDRHRLPMAARLHDESGNIDLARTLRERAISPLRLNLETGARSAVEGIESRWDELFYHDMAAAEAFAQARAASGFSQDDWESGACHLPLLAQAYDEPQWHQLTDLARPSMLMRGRFDLVTSPDQIEAYQNGTGSAISTFENSSHFAQFEEPDEYAAVVTEYITQQR